MKAVTVPVSRRRATLEAPLFHVPRRKLGDIVESSLYYVIAMTFVFPYVVVKRLLPRSWTHGFIGNSKPVRQSVFREAHVEVQTALGSVFRA